MAFDRWSQLCLQGAYYLYGYTTLFRQTLFRQTLFRQSMHSLDVVWLTAVE